MPNAWSQRPISALFVSGRSFYRYMPNVRSYGERENALSFDGKTPAVMHPPCRTWSKFLKAQARPLDWEAEQNLGRWAVATLMHCGGVLEQPAGSGLWADQNLPRPGEVASRKIFTLYVEQRWFGYPTRKPTWLLIVGVERPQIPPMPYSLVETSHAKRAGSKAERSRTMPAFAEWLCQIARSVNTWP